MAPVLLGQASNRFDGGIEQIAYPPFRFDQAGHTGIGFQFATESQDLNVNAAIEDVFMHPRGLHQVFAAEWTSRRIQEGDQQPVLRFGQRHRDVIWIGETAQAPIEQPAPAKLATALSGIATRSRQARLASPQHRADARKQFAQPKGFGNVVVRTELEANDAIHFIATMTSRYDDRYIRARPDRTQEVQSIVLAELEIEYNQTWLVREMSSRTGAIGGRNDLHTVLGEIILDHPTNGAIVLDEEHLRMPSGILVGAAAKRCVQRRLGKLFAAQIPYFGHESLPTHFLVSAFKSLCGRRNCPYTNC